MTNLKLDLSTDDPGLSRQNIKDLRIGDEVASVFVVRNKRLVDFRNKQGKFLTLGLTDATGEINAVLWEDAEETSRQFIEGDAVHVQGRLEEYRGSAQLNVNSLRPASAREYAPEAFLRQSSKNVDQLLERLQKAIDSVKQRHFRRLLESFFRDPDFVAAFRQAPAAKSVHHAYLGGLIEHVVNVVEIGSLIAECYPQINRDLLITVAMLHDIGKLRELRYGISIAYSDEGQLVGHTVMGERIVADRMNAIAGFPDADKLLVRHMILSHHGEHEYGAPKLPQCVEASALHHADNLDAQVNRFLEIIRQQGEPARPWTEYDAKLNRSLYTGRGELETSDGWR